MTLFYVQPDTDKLMQPTQSKGRGGTPAVSSIAAIRQVLSSLQLQQGDTVDAQVQRVKPHLQADGKPTDPPSFQVNIKLGNQQITAITQQPISEQSIIKLLVKNDHQLQLIEILPTKASLQIQEMLRTSTSQQSSYAPLLANLLQLKQHPISHLLSIKPEQLTHSLAKSLFIQLPHLLQQLTNTLPSAQQLQHLSINPHLQDTSASNSHSSPPLRVILSQLGQFMERHLSQLHPTTVTSNRSLSSEAVQQVVDRDFKAILLKLQHLFQSVLSQLQQPTATAQTRMNSDPALLALQSFYSLMLYQSHFKTKPHASTPPTMTSAQLAAFAQVTPPLSGLSFFSRQPPSLPTLLSTLSSQQNPLLVSEQLVQQLKSSLSRLLLTQWNNLQNWTMNNDQASPRLFSFELPIQDQQQIHTLQCQIEKRELPPAHDDQPHANQEGGPVKAQVWRVSLSFDVEPLGALYLQLSLHMPYGLPQPYSRSDPITPSPDSDALQTDQAEYPVKTTAHIWAEQNQTAQLAQQHLQTLRDMLISIGLDVEHLDCQQGTIPKSHIGVEQHLIDLNT